MFICFLILHYLPIFLKCILLYSKEIFLDLSISLNKLFEEHWKTITNDMGLFNPPVSKASRVETIFFFFFFLVWPLVDPGL